VTFKTRVSSSGEIQLGGDARLRAGFAAGTLVEVIVTSSGSLIIAIDQSPPPLDARFRPVTGRAGAALAQRTRRRTSLTDGPSILPSGGSADVAAQTGAGLPSDPSRSPAAASQPVAAVSPAAVTGAPGVRP
jgi:hypothetical protein